MNEWMINALSGCFINWIAGSHVNKTFTDKFNLLTRCKSPFLFNWQKESSPVFTYSTDYNDESEQLGFFVFLFFPFWPLYTLILGQLSYTD